VLKKFRKIYLGESYLLLKKTREILLYEGIRDPNQKAKLLSLRTKQLNDIIDPYQNRVDSLFLLREEMKRELYPQTDSLIAIIKKNAQLKIKDRMRQNPKFNRQNVEMNAVLDEFYFLQNELNSDDFYTGKFFDSVRERVKREYMK